MATQVPCHVHHPSAPVSNGFANGHEVQRPQRSGKRSALSLTRRRRSDQSSCRWGGMDVEGSDQRLSDFLSTGGSEEIAGRARSTILLLNSWRKAFGGLKESSVRRLRELALGTAIEAQAAYRPKSGTRYVREHDGKLHEVTVLDNGFDYKGESDRSLTEIAKAITGTKSSGPAFFGLKRKKLYFRYEHKRHYLPHRRRNCHVPTGPCTDCANR